MKKTFISIFLLGFFILSPDVLAYDSGTHAFLTKSAVDLYNGTAAIQFPRELEDYFMDGSRREDDIPRSFNHFYDPVYQRGLTYNPAINAVNIPGKWETSKSWAENPASQNAIVYKVAPTIASILSAIEKGKMSVVSTDSDFTWQKAIDLYRAGKKEEAMFALGHVIHLIEDTSVPDHTRDDPHPGGSPYENWAAKFTPESPDPDLAKKLNGEQPVVLADLGSSFDAIANYSNNNFYSRNTIGLQGGYNLPVADMSDLDVRSGKYYVMGHDGEGNEYPLLKKNSVLSLLFDFKNVTITMDDDLVKGSYWSLLSKKAVQYAAGVLDLFFRTAQAASVQNQAATTIVQDTATSLPSASGAREAVIPRPVVFTDRSVVKVGEKIIESGEHFTPLGKISLVFDLPNGRTVRSNITANGSGNFENSYSVPLDAVLGNYAYYAEDMQNGAMSGKVMYSVVSEIKKVASGSTPSASTSSPSASGARETATSTTAPPAAQQCTFNANNAASHAPVILNEVAWMGGSETYGLNASDEWFELRNVTGATVDLSGWQIISKKGSIKMTLPPGARVSPWGFYLLERTDDNAVPNIPADLIYVGGLSNADDGLEIFAVGCGLVDRVLADSEWPAGDASLRRTMERKDDFSWYTSGSFNGKIFGTPKAPNGPAYIPPQNQNQVVYVGGGGGNQGGSSDSSSPPNLAITEIMYDYPGSDAGHEWVEVKNVGAADADLSEIKLYTDNTAHNLNFAEGNSLLLPGSFAVFSNGSTTVLQDFPDFSGNLFYGSFSLNNASGTIALKYRDTVFGSISYASTTGAHGDGNSLQIVNGDWTWSRPTPGAENVLDQSLGGDESVTSSTSTPPVAGSESDRVVVSEVQVGGVDAGDEFIELYNPGVSDVDLGGWSFQYVSGGASSISSSTVSKSSFGAGSIIRAKGFFLIARDVDNGGSDGYAGRKTPDVLYRNFSLSGGSNGGGVFLVSTTTDINSLDDASIMSAVFYGNGDIFTNAHPAPVPGNGESLERKAFRGGYCLSTLPGADGEFLGNGCDSGSSALDFIVRADAEPQNTQSLPEPRAAPIAPTPFPGRSAIADYRFDDMVIGFKWSASRDSTGSPSGATYYLSRENDGEFSFVASTTFLEFTYPLAEIGREYRFRMTAFDRDGMPSGNVDMVVATPFANTMPVVFSQSILADHSQSSFYSDNWYQLGRGFSGTLQSLSLRGVVSDASFFASHVYLKEFEDGDYSHETASFTLSDNAPFTNELNNVKIANLNIPLYPFSYYRLDTYQDYQNRSVVLLGTANRGNAMSNSFVTDVGRVIQEYPFYPFVVIEGEIGPAVDVTIPQKPTMPPLNEVAFDQFGMNLSVSWASSTDLDSLDTSIAYEYNATTLSDFNEGEWKNVGGNLSVNIPVIFPNRYKIGLRAVDDTNLRSDVASTTWEFPAGFSPYLLTSSFNSVFQDWTASASVSVESVEFKTADFSTGSANPWSNSCRVDMYDVTDGTETMIAGSLSSLGGPGCAGNPIFYFDPASSTVTSGRRYRFKFFFDACAWAGQCGVKFYGTNENTAGGLFSNSSIKNAALRIKSGAGYLFSNF